MKWMWGVLLGAITTNTAMNLSVRSIGDGISGVASSIHFPRPHGLQSLCSIWPDENKSLTFVNFKIQDAQTGFAVEKAELELVQANGYIKKLQCNAEGFCGGQFNLGDQLEVFISSEGYETEFLILDLPENRESITQTVKVNLLPKAKIRKKSTSQQAPVSM